MATWEPLIAQLAHVEILTPRVEDSVWFFRDVLGLEESGRDGRSIYLRAYEDFYHHTLKLTEADGPGLGHVAWRAASEEALQAGGQRITPGGRGGGRAKGGPGHRAPVPLLHPGGPPDGAR